MATTTSTADRIFDALNESYAALLDAIKAGNERGYRVSKALIEEAERGQGEVLELGRKFAQDPADLAGFSTALIEATTKAQGRALELTREWFEELSGASNEARDAVQRVVRANREAGQAAVEVARGLFSRTTEAFQSAISRPAPSTPRSAGDGRSGRRTGEAAEAS